MKKPLVLFALLLATFIPPARAVDSLPYFGSLRNEVLNQFNLATNGVPEPDKKLVSALRKALTTIDKTQPNYAAGVKALGVVAKGLNRTSVSNAFAPDLQNIVGNYVASLLIDGNGLSNRLASTYPSKPHTAAQNSLNQLGAALDQAIIATDVIAAAKLLSAAVKNFSTAGKNVDKAEDVPPPPASIMANVSGATSVSINTQGAGITPGAPGSYGLLGDQAILNPPGQRTISFSLSGVTDGTHTVALANGTIVLQVGISASTYSGGTGTANITLNSATHSLFGTFTFTANGSAGTVGTVTVTGSFTGSY